MLRHDLLSDLGRGLNCSAGPDARACFQRISRPMVTLSSGRVGIIPSTIGVFCRKICAPKAPRQHHAVLLYATPNLVHQQARARSEMSAAWPSGSRGYRGLVTVITGRPTAEAIKRPNIAVGAPRPRTRPALAVCSGCRSGRGIERCRVHAHFRDQSR